MPFYQQTKAIFYKNIKIQFDTKWKILKELIAPIITSLVIYYIQVPALQFILLPLYIPASNSGFLRQLIVNLVSEKQEKFKEYFKIMGMKELPYLLGNLILSYLSGFMSVVIITFAFSYSNVLKTNEEIVWTIVALSLYTIASTHQFYFFSTFFSQPKLAAEVTGFLTLLSSAFIFLLLAKQNINYYYLVCLMPQPCLSLAIFSQLAQHNELFEKLILLPYHECIWMLIFDCFIYILLYYYFENVFPNEYGVKKHPCFLLISLKNCITDQLNKISLINQGFRNIDGNNNIELINESDQQSEIIQQNPSSAIIYEPIANLNNRKISIKLSNLQKFFDQTIAVDNITLNMYENEIFCLLGHNGAGKTTTINLMTGMLAKDSGKIIINTHDIDYELDQARSNIGYCMQKDIVYDSLTVQEHLSFMANLKGIEPSEIQNHIDQVIQDVGLQNEIDKPSSELSGGNKRKLSLGMAIISQKSNILFLDEPSSGILKLNNYKKQI